MTEENIELYILKKDYEVVSTDGTIILGKAGDQLARCYYYSSDFSSKYDHYPIKKVRENISIDLNYQFSVINLDRKLINDYPKWWNINSFVVKSEDVYRLSNADIKGKIEQAKKLNLEFSSYITSEEEAVCDYFIEQRNLFLVLEELNIEKGNHIIANRGDLVVSTGEYSNHCQFEVISATKKISEDKILNNGIFVVNRDKVVKLPISANMSLEERGTYWEYAFKRLYYHNASIHEMINRTNMAEESIEEYLINEEMRGHEPRISTGNENEDFWNDTLDSMGYGPNDRDAFFDSYKTD